VKRLAQVLFVACGLSVGSSVFAAEPIDSRIVGSWQGMRDESGKCEFLAWKSQFSADGKFRITFFEDKGRTKELQTETGTWKSVDGKNILKTDGVPTLEVYTYTVIDENTIKYVNTVKDPTADCQEDYEFTEQRVKQ
jgi:hypothetical protein